MRLRPLHVASSSAARRFVKLAIVIALVPAVGGCQRPQPTPNIPAGYQPIAGSPVDFTFPHKGNNLSVQVRVDATPSGSVGFNVYTDQQWRDLTAGVRPVTPAGLGVTVVGEPGALGWEGGSPDSGMYHVRVFPIAQPAAFKIAVAGPGAGGSTLADNVAANPVPDEQPAGTEEPSPISLDSTPEARPTRAGKALAAAAAAAPGAEVGAAKVTPLADAGGAKTGKPKAAGPAVEKNPQPLMAQTGAGNFNTISDQAMEFVFQYPGGNDPVNVIVGASPSGSVGFSVYTDQQWALFGSGDLGITPTGKGTPNPNEPGSLFWRGISSSPGVYHVRVYRLAESASFWIALSGPGATALFARSPAVEQ